LDSGASINIISNLNLLIDIKKCNEETNLANGQIITAVHKGKFKGYVNNNEIILNEVYYFPAINKNLISIFKLLKENYKIVFNNSNNKSYAIIYDSNYKRIVNITATKTNTFKIWFSNNKINLNNNNNQHNNLEINFTTPNEAKRLNLWHRRLCHFDISHIKNKLLKLNTPVNQCSICMNSKLKNNPYKQATNKSKHVFELLHMDLVGPLPESLYGNKYLFTILDDYSRYGWTLFLKSKSDTFNSFYNWFLSIKNKYNTRIIYIRTDNGTEFCNNNFNLFFKSYGIKHQLTVPYNPQQNGRVERFNGTLINSAKAMLNDSKLSHQFWEDATSTANYIHNRIPHKGINMKIPYEIINKTKVNYSNIKVFGCKVYFFIPKVFRSKFDNNTKPGIFLGYSENPSAYKILDITTNKIILSRSVAFFESNPGNSYLKECSPEFSNFIPDHEIRGDNTYNTYYNKNTYDTNTYNINHNIQQRLNKIDYPGSKEFFNSENILSNSPILNNSNIQNIYEDIINKNNSKNKRKYNKKQRNNNHSNNNSNNNNENINNDNCKELINL